MSDLNAALLDAMTGLVHRRKSEWAGIPDDARVVAYSERAEYSSGCGTCDMGQSAAVILHLDTGQSFMWFGDFGELVRELTD